MRISEDRYSRDLRRIHLAQRMIRHEARTQWIRAWTGLSGERVRNLFHSYEESLEGARRRRGPSPRRIASYLRSPGLRAEASAAGGLACVLGLVPESPMRSAKKTLPNLESGERLCDVYELYRQIVPEAKLTMDQLIILVIALAEQEDLEIAHCRICNGALLVDRLGASRRACLACRQAAPQPAFDTAVQSTGVADASPEDTDDTETSIAHQQSLF
jgi:hypothetical protein